MAMPSLKLEGKYEILRKLHAGGMGDILLVRHRMLDEERVIKTMRPQLAAEAQFQQRFYDEARSASKLKHENIAQVHDFHIDEDGNAYIVLEYIEGVSLKEILEHHGPPPLPLALEIARQSISVLEFLHGRNKVHRDISPDNLMLTRTHDGLPWIKLIDLGIVKDLEKQGNLTTTGHFLGKVRYSSPEHFGELGAGGAEPRSDQYSFGLVLYELLTGRSPIGGTDPASYTAGHLYRAPLSFVESDPERRVPDDLRAVVMKTLAKRPGDRFGDTSELSRALHDIAARHPYVANDDFESLVEEVSEARNAKALRAGDSTQARLDEQFGLEVTPARLTAQDTQSFRPPSQEDYSQHSVHSAVTGQPPSHSPASPDDSRPPAASLGDKVGDVPPTQMIPTYDGSSPYPGPGRPERSAPSITPLDAAPGDGTVRLDLGDLSDLRRQVRAQEEKDAGSITDTGTVILGDIRKVAARVAAEQAQREPGAWSDPEASEPPTARITPPPLPSSPAPELPAQPSPEVGEPAASPAIDPPLVREEPDPRPTPARTPPSAVPGPPPLPEPLVADPPSSQASASSLFLEPEPPSEAPEASSSSRWARPKDTGPPLPERILGWIRGQARSFSATFGPFVKTLRDEALELWEITLPLLKRHRVPIGLALGPLVLITILLLILFTGEPDRAPTETVTEAAAPPTPEPVPVEPPPTVSDTLHPEVEQLELCWGWDDPDCVAEQLAVLESGEVTLSTRDLEKIEEIRSLMETAELEADEDEALEPLEDADALLATLEQSLAEGPIKSLLDSYNALFEMRKSEGVSIIPEDRMEIYQRGHEISSHFYQMWAARNRTKKPMDVISNANWLMKEYPVYANAQRLRDEAAELVEKEADELLAADQAQGAVTRLKELRKLLPDRAGLDARLAQAQKAVSLDQAIEASLAEVRQTLDARDPEEGLRLLDALRVPDAYAEQAGSLRSELRGLLRSLDQSPPRVELVEGQELRYRRKEAALLRLKISDDLRIVSTQVHLRFEGAGGFQADTLKLRQTSEQRYELEIPESVHERRKTIELYITATDPSGQVGSLGSARDPIVLERRGIF